MDKFDVWMWFLELDVDSQRLCIVDLTRLAVRCGRGKGEALGNALEYLAEVVHAEGDLGEAVRERALWLRGQHESNS